MARALGIRNLNVDLMSGLPGQTLQDWRESIARLWRSAWSTSRRIA